MRKKKILMILAMLLTAVTGAWAQAMYTVTVKDGTEDAANWSADPNPAREGQGVTIKYNGKKKVKRVTAVQKALRPLAKATTSDYGKVVHEGEAVVEMVGTVHHGENRGTKPVILYMFYLSQKDLPLAVQHPDIPLE